MRRRGSDFCYLIFGDKDSDGTAAAIEKSEHIGMLQDSVLLYSDSTTLYSYFPFADNKIEFYGCSDDDSRKEGQLLGYIANTGEKAIVITFTWGESVSLIGGEEITVFYGMSGNVDNG